MGMEIVVCGGDEICAFDRQSMQLLRRGELRGACALCADGNGALYAGGMNGAVSRLCGQTLDTQAVFAGGPGLRQLLLSADGARLYALCADADSVLMLSAPCGAPQVLCRAGVNPRAMALDERAGILAVAGGEAGTALLFDAWSLKRIAALNMPGPVHAVSLHAGRLCALCLTETLDSLLVLCSADGRRREIALPGMPGALLSAGDLLQVSVYGALYAADGACVCAAYPAPGRAGRLIAAQDCVLMVDELSEALYVMTGGRFRRICTPASDAVLLRRIERERPGILGVKEKRGDCR